MFLCVCVAARTQDEIPYIYIGKCCASVCVCVSERQRSGCLSKILIFLGISYRKYMYMRVQSPASASSSVREVPTTYFKQLTVLYIHMGVCVCEWINLYTSWRQEFEDLRYSLQTIRKCARYRFKSSPSRVSLRLQ